MPRRHRSHSTQFKRQVVAEYRAGETPHARGRRHDVSRNLIRIWIEKAEAGARDRRNAIGDNGPHRNTACEGMRGGRADPRGS